MKKISFLLFAFFNTLLNAQENQTSDLYQALYSQDSLLFNIGFNTCDIAQFERLVSEDFEFYHDQSGVTQGKAAFLQNTREGLCKLDYQPRRKLVEGSLEVYPLYNNGTLYGAIQRGDHRFYALYRDGEEKLTSTAIFTHVWKLEEDGVWRLSRVLSFDHKPAGE